VVTLHNMQVTFARGYFVPVAMLIICHFASTFGHIPHPILFKDIHAVLVFLVLSYFVNVLNFELSIIFLYFLTYSSYVTFVLC
jgi:hypothetical protein